jgi:glutamate N-acetyltransferase/amino-acid N-acetyltransferase
MIPRLLMPKGFKASGINSGVRRYRPDLGIILSETDCVCVGTFTRNTLKAAPVQYDMKLLPSDKIRSLIVNSGHANAATGAEGLEDNLLLAQRAASTLGIQVDQVVIASTGVIGVRLPLEILGPAIPAAVRSFSETINNFALAIMTTDLVPKGATVEVKLSQGSVVLTGVAKGSGMIHPNMGTMLGFIFTDAKLDLKFADSLLKSVVDKTFNMISVDGETSTNDTVLLLANGATNVALVTDDDRKKFAEALTEVSQKLAISIARDGEGATKLVTVRVEGASTLLQAQDAARYITTSPLIKSAVHGEDPNWGRILARLGQSGVDAAAFDKLSVILQGVEVFVKGKPVTFDRAAARQKLHSENIEILVQLASGNFEATAWGCDLTKRYVEINTEYS